MKKTTMKNRLIQGVIMEMMRTLLFQIHFKDGAKRRCRWVGFGDVV
jgi:translation initiation factor IF-1